MRRADHLLQCADVLERRAAARAENASSDLDEASALAMRSLAFVFRIQARREAQSHDRWATGRAADAPRRRWWRVTPVPQRA